MKKSIAATVFAYLIWGFLPLYWKLLGHIKPLYILSDRIVFACLCMFALLFATKSIHSLKAVFKSRRAVLCTIASSILITINWGLYIWAVNSNMVVDASLGYYINPLMVFALSVVIFKEKSRVWEYVAFALAAAGVLYMTLHYGKFPYVALSLATSFSLYGVFKKMANLEPSVSLTLETAFVTPLALGFMLFNSFGQTGQLAFVGGLEAILLLLAGVVTATPLLLYAIGVKGLPFSLVGFFQYICPTIMLLLGVFVFGEAFDVNNLISFACIWAGLAIFTVSKLRQSKKEATARVEALLAEATQVAE